jgi:hypothetical protein
MRARLRFPTPATVIALAALFFALGGSAFAVGDALTAKAQPYCAQGAVRGVAVVTGDPNKGIANIPDQFSSTKALFSRTFNCTGKATQVRRVDRGVYEVRFVGNGAKTAVGSAVGNAFAAVEPVAGGAFKISIHPAGRDDLVDAAFSVVAV